MNPNCWPEWTDCLGQTFYPGDYVAYAGMSWKSADLVIGVVDRINRYRNDGSEITISYYDYKNQTHVTQPYCSVRVIPLVEKDGIWGEKEGEWLNGEYIPAPPERPRTLQKVHHIVKLNWRPKTP